jgi:hypothetical protein
VMDSRSTNTTHVGWAKRSVPTCSSKHNHGPLMKTIACALSLLILCACSSKQQASSPDPRPTPQAVAAPSPPSTTWREEKMPFPPQFAPNLPYRGDLIVKFHPQWRQFDAPEGFSYVFHWVIEPADLSSDKLSKVMTDYFDGLMTLVGKSRSIAAQGEFSPARTTLTKNSNTWIGNVATWNAFNRGEALVLNIEGIQRQCSNGRTQLSFALSKLPLDAAIWKDLRVVRDTQQC